MKRKLPYIALLLILYGNLFGQKLPDKIDKLKQEHDLMGGIVVLFNQKGTIESIPFGIADYKRNIPVTDETMFRIASISKTITSIAVMQMVEKGKLSLDGDIGNYLGFNVKNPKFPGVPITVRMLLTHTSSLLDGPTYDGFLEAVYAEPSVPDIMEILASGGRFYSDSTFANHRPGTYFTYCNLNFGTLGTLVEKVSGMRFDKYCIENIFNPLGIEANFNVAGLNNMNNLAVLYRKEKEIWTPQTDNLQGKRPDYPYLEKYVPGTNAVRFGPQGGLRISGKNLAIIYSAFMNYGKYNNVRILKIKTIKQMFSPQWTFNGVNGNSYNGLMLCWGLGIHIITNTEGKDLIFKGKRNMAGHTGDAYGLISSAFIDFTSKKGLVFITNGSGNEFKSGSESGFYITERDVFEIVKEFF